MDGECANLMVEKTTMFASDLIVIGHYERFCMHIEVDIYLLQKTYGRRTARQGLFDSDQV
jgi:hypothetical protein